MSKHFYGEVAAVIPAAFAIHVGMQLSTLLSDNGIAISRASLSWSLSKQRTVQTLGRTKLY